MKALLIASVLGSLFTLPAFAGSPSAQNDSECVVLENVNSVSAAAAKVALCHYDKTEDTWFLISVPAKASTNHLKKHDDALPGGLSGVTLTQLDLNCVPAVAPVPVPVEPTPVEPNPVEPAPAAAIEEESEAN